MEAIKRILIADDDEAILDAVGALLKLEGFDVITSHNGAIARDMKDPFPDIFLLDVWMAGTDGRDVCRYLKQNENTRHIPVIMTSASIDIEQSTLVAGADAFIAKPFEINHLVRKIRQHLA